MNLKTFIRLTFILNLFTVPVLANTMRDSVGVENVNGKKVIIHKIEPKETYYSLGRKYNVNPSRIMQFNNGIALHPAELIKIPTDVEFSQSSNKPISFNPGKSSFPTISHTVKAGETLYSIAKLYKMELDELKTINNLSKNSLSIGEVLKVKAPSISTENPIKTPPVPSTTNTEPITNIKMIDSTDSQYKANVPKNKYGITEVNEKGSAVWLADANLDGSKSYVLHRSAPIGTVMRITNPMTEKSVFAKVVGRFTENESTKDVIIVMTKAAADAIGTLDKRFLVNITFGIPTNEQQ